MSHSSTESPSPPPSPPLVQLDRVGIRFGSQEVLREITLNIQRGETVVIIGESGCGKTVFLKLIIGLLVPSTGQASFDGKVLSGLDERELTRQRLRCGFVFQGAALFDSLTVYENVAFPLREHTRQGEEGIRQAVRQSLQEVGLPSGVESKLPAQLSGGMRKRVGLARATILKPELLLYDEPTTGLDPVMSDVIDELILQMRQHHQVTSIIVTHDMKTVRKVADRVIMLYPLARLKPQEPQIVFDGSRAALEEATDPRVRQFVRGEGAAFLRNES